MATEAPSRDHAALMDGVYRFQRHVYDLTRKYFLLGRDRMIAGLDIPSGGSVLELGCGTGRNLVLVGRRYPSARLFGLDISAEMLETARASVRRAGLGGRALLTRADATDFDPRALFSEAAFDRVFISYSLSMIPEWQRAVAAGLACLAPGGSLHVVDFGRQEALPSWFRRLLRGWLRKFHVAPRDSMREVLEVEAARIGATLSFESHFRGYAVLATITRPEAIPAP